MEIGELFEGAGSIRKTVWRKRGDAVTRCEVERLAPGDAPPRTRLDPKEKPDAEA